MDGCFPCFASGVVCYDGRGCVRFSRVGTVSITKDTVVDNYMGEGDERGDASYNRMVE